MDDLTKIANRFFRVVIRSRSYLNVLYLLLSFPLGLTYFIFLVVGLSLGIGLMIVWVGFLVLALVFGFWIAFMALERVLANAMLGENIPPIQQPVPADSSLWQRFKILVSSRSTWLGFVYLLVKFPLGIFSFTAVVSLFITSLALVASPLIYRFAVIDLGFTVVSNLSEAFLAMLIGLLLWPVSLHICNGIAWISGRFARVMLSPAATRHAITPSEASENVLKEAGPDVLPEDTSDSVLEHMAAKSEDSETSA
ncbi:MAG: sensor domain-containing protein [Anaerolineales bacterium]|nr:sensor domain-containing protein [Anaerolineales bacterium]